MQTISNSLSIWCPHYINLLIYQILDPFLLMVPCNQVRVKTGTTNNLLCFERYAICWKQIDGTRWSIPTKSYNTCSVGDLFMIMRKPVFRIWDIIVYIDSPGKMLSNFNIFKSVFICFEDRASFYMTNCFYFILPECEFLTRTILSLFSW